MSQIFRLDGGWGVYQDVSWDWSSWGYVILIEIAIAHVLLVFCWIHVRFAKRSTSRLIIFTFPILVSSVYSIVANYTPVGTQTSIGYALYDFQSFIQIVSLFGLCGLNFTILSISACIAHAFFIDSGNDTVSRSRGNVNGIWTLQNDDGRLNRKKFAISFGFGLFLANWLFGSIRLLAPYMYQKSVIDTAIPASGWINAACVVHDTGSDTYEATVDLLERDPNTGFVLWSEVALDETYYDIVNSAHSWQTPKLSKLTDKLKTLSNTYNTTIAATYAVWAKPDDYFDETVYNNIVFIDPWVGSIGAYSKAHPVPFLENDVVAVDNDMLVGDSVTIGNFTVGICFDFDFPSFVRSGMNQNGGGGGLLIQTANTWGIVGRYHGISSSFRAIENGAYLVRCGSNGPSGLWDYYGSTLAYQSRADSGIMQFQIPHNPDRVWTVYNSFGFVFDYIIYAFAVGYLVAFGFSYRKQHPATNQQVYATAPSVSEMTTRFA
jgi:apolipoprotein N-acyltransferase